jgi:SAM-dependent methyltransferase
MERAAYELMASHEQVHWWFVGRRAVIDAVLARVPLGPDARILEAGCGSGGNLRLLQARGHVSAFEPFDPALDTARMRFPAVDIRPGELPDALPFDPKTFDLVAALVVVVHVDDDQAALAALVGLA